MTGYGQGESSMDGVRFAVEIRSVNHRYLEVMVRLPSGWTSLEESVKKTVRSHFRRGRVDVFITVEGGGNTRRRAVVDREVAGSIVQAAQQLKKEYQLEGSISIGDLLRLPEVLKVEDPKWDPEEIRDPLLRALEQACCSLKKMRLREGETLAADLTRRAESLSGYVEAIRERAPLVAETHREKLRQRLEEFLEQTEVNEDRLLAEAALFAERADIQEELTRIDSHIGQLREALHQDEPVGRRLDFLLQEMNREVNTIGSKANDATITNRVVDCKSELEKMREQVQNIE
ncbi:YicC/YloC family endoribonuclease [Paludifilum halophilum]|nr:YicC/YloC family endoribonuclease [Paludifilum halophilum]